MTRERYLSDAELARFMAAVRSRRHVHRARDHAFFALLANSGLRPSEARALRARDVHVGPRSRWIAVPRQKKNGPEPTTELVLARSVAGVLRVYMASLDGQKDRLLFPFSKRQSGRLFHYYGSKAGIPETLRLYSLRHSCGMRLWRHTRDLRLIQAVLGHHRLKASRAYEHVLSETISEAYGNDWHRHLGVPMLFFLFGVMVGLGAGLLGWILNNNAHVTLPINLPESSADAYRLGYDHGLRGVHDHHKRSSRLDD